MKFVRPLLVAIVTLNISGLVFADSGTKPTHNWKPVHEWIPGRDWYYLLPPGLEYSELRLKHGDDLAWADPALDEQNWDIVPNYTELPVRTGIFWLRVHVRLPANSQPFGDRIMANLTASYDLFWDGKYVGSSGKPGNNFDSETPGIGLAFLTTPLDRRDAGEHVMAFRISSYRYTVPTKVTWIRFYVDDSLKDEEYRWLQRIVPGTAASAMALISFAAFVLWLMAERSTHLLLLCGVFFSGTLLQAYTVAVSFRQWTTASLLWANHTNTFLFALCGVMIVGFITHFFNLPHRRWLLTLLITCLAVWIITYQGGRTRPPFFKQLHISYSFALACSLWAIWHQKSGSWIVAAGIAGSALMIGFQDGTSTVFNTNYFLNSSPTHLSLIVAVALDIRSRRQQARQTELTAARLEIELLKKTLQPHFLLNTLTALSQVVEENPVKASQLIDDLGAEFRALSGFSSEKQNPLSREIELCRTHLRVMSTRTERDWKLVADGINPDALVPPALFLTLIENCFSHQEPIAGLTTFTLNATTTDSTARYMFFSPGRVRIRQQDTPGGTGLRYIKARLDEGWPDHWSLSQGQVTNGWQTIITLHTHAHAHLDR